MDLPAPGPDPDCVSGMYVGSVMSFVSSLALFDKHFRLNFLLACLLIFCVFATFTLLCLNLVVVKERNKYIFLLFYDQ